MKSITQVTEFRRKYQRGAVTITYLAPYTSAPTTAQMTGTPNCTVVATVAATSASDTSAVITHDFGLSAAEITQGFPKVTIVSQADPEITSPWWEASQQSNYSVLQKNTTAAGVLSKVFIERPHSITK